MTILVSGGAGYIGGHTVLELLDIGERVVVLDDLSTGYRSAVPPQANFIRGDIGNKDLVRALFREFDITAIFHFAGKIVVSELVTEPLMYYRNNSAKLGSLLECSVEAGIKQFIFSSSAAVYGEPGVALIPETAELAPINPYGCSKVMGEWQVQDAAKAYGFQYAILRYFNVAGADPKGRHGESGPPTHLVHLIAKTVVGQRDHLKVFGVDYATPDGTCVRDYVQVTDLAKAHLLSLQHLRQGGDSFIANCGYGLGFSVAELVAAAKLVTGVDFEVRFNERRAGDPAVLVADSQLIKKLLGWVPAHQDLSTIVAQAVAWEHQLAVAPRVA